MSRRMTTVNPSWRGMPDFGPAPAAVHSVVGRDPSCSLDCPNFGWRGVYQHLEHQRQVTSIANPLRWVGHYQPKVSRSAALWWRRLDSTT